MRFCAMMHDIKERMLAMKKTWKTYNEYREAVSRLRRLYRPESRKAAHAAAFLKRAGSDWTSPLRASSDIAAAMMLLDKLAAEERAARHNVRERSDAVAKAALERMDALLAEGVHFRTVAHKLGSSIYFYVRRGGEWTKVRFSDHRADIYGNHGTNGSGYKLPDEDNVLVSS